MTPAPPGLDEIRLDVYLAQCKALAGGAADPHVRRWYAELYRLTLDRLRRVPRRT